MTGSWLQERTRLPALWRSGKDRTEILGCSNTPFLPAHRPKTDNMPLSCFDSNVPEKALFCSTLSEVALKAFQIWFNTGQKDRLKRILNSLPPSLFLSLADAFVVANTGNSVFLGLKIWQIRRNCFSRQLFFSLLTFQTQGDCVRVVFLTECGACVN